MIGQTIAHYEVLERLGGGGMGVVYRARDTKLGRHVALKFLSPGLVESETAKARFMAEARAASALDHANIGTIHAIEETPDGDLFIVMAFYEGETVAQRIARGPLPPHEAVDVAVQAAEGLARAHGRDIVHRDVKPANLLVTPERVVKVLDFGLAKMGDIRLTDAGTAVGTPAYMSPEQARGRQVDHRTDIWSLGVVLHEMLSGHLPFSGESRSQVIEAILGEEPAPLHPPAGAPSRLEPLVRRALAKDPAGRHDSMVAFLEELLEVRRELAGLSALETAAGEAPSDEGPTFVSDLTGVVPPRSAFSSGLHPSGERRQVSVLSCELAPFLSLAEELDPEDLRDVLAAFHRTATLVVSGLDGRIAKSEQGQVVAHFGFPTAHEDDAQRAVRAGLGIAAGMEEASRSLRSTQGRSLPTRAAVHTGRMVSGDARGASGDSTLVGNVPAIAARLRDAAPDGAVVVSGATRRLVEKSFELEPTGEREVPGLDRAVDVFLVRGEGDMTDGVHSSVSPRVTPFVGREQDLALLRARWEQAKEGAGQVVLLSGEAGIGKSRLVLELREGIADEVHLWLEGRASPYHSGDALHSVAGMLARLAGFADEASSEERRGRLEETLQPYELPPEALSLLATLLSLPLPESWPAPPPSPQKRMQRTMETLLELLVALSTRQPVVLFVEDLHWVDPSTEELLGQIAGQCATLPLLVLVTARPGHTAPWLAEDHVTRLPLSRLSQAHTRALVEQLASGGVLGAEVLEAVVSRTDGVPLFVEELTRALSESPMVEGSSSTTASGGPGPLEIPATLQESLAARLDRLGLARGVAQLAAVLGREFPHRWLEAVWGPEVQALANPLARLLESGLVLRRGTPPNATYLFKHALVQEAAYGSLLRSTRQEYHGRVARALEESFPETADQQPHLVARHYAEAGQPELGIAWWTRAAEREGERFANREAAAALRHALALLEQQPEGPARDGQELGLQMRLATILPSVSGYASEETERAHLRAQELCDRLGSTSELYWVLYGLWAFSFVRARLERSRQQALHLRPLGDERGDVLSRIAARYASGVTLAFLGELHGSRRDLEAAVAVDEDGRPPDFSAGMELGVTAPAYLAMVLWLLGDADAALERIREAVARARTLEHPLTLGFALYYLVWVYLHRGEVASAREHVQELLRLSEEHGLFFGALGRTLLGWVLDQRGALVAAWSAEASSGDFPDDQALDHVRAGLQFYQATGSVVNQTHMLSLLALGHARRGQWAEARRAVDEALAFGEETGETWWTPELHRLSGELALAADGEDAPETAEASFRRALEIAGGQHALALELRAATSLARLLRSTDRAAEGHALLSGALERVTEGEETGDVQAARLLLADLG
ncbi:MAG: protein kinase [Acidobacteria bacterium]|nr:protein kinase [Acidobacteriota bacterium]